MNQYVVFLRGINVGGKTIKMDALRQALEAAGFENVSTLLASGNAVLDAKQQKREKVRAEIENLIQKTFGLKVHVLVRSAKEIVALIAENPFKHVKTTPKTRLYISFVDGAAKSGVKLPYTALAGNYKIISVEKGYVASVLTLSPKSGTVDAMAILEKEWGKQTTMRNWNTLLKIRSLLRVP